MKDGEAPWPLLRLPCLQYRPASRFACSFSGLKAVLAQVKLKSHASKSKNDLPAACPRSSNISRRLAHKVLRHVYLSRSPPVSQWLQLMQRIAGAVATLRDALCSFALAFFGSDVRSSKAKKPSKRVRLWAFHSLGMQRAFGRLSCCQFNSINPKLARLHVHDSCSMQEDADAL